MVEYLELSLTTCESLGMRKSTLIAHCLVNSRMYTKLEDAEARVRNVFESEFPNQNFVKWNSDIDDKFAAQRIKDCGVASQIRVNLFIEELR